MADTKLNNADVKVVRDALLALAPLAKKFANVDRVKLEESEDKFFVIRMVRLEHLIRETLNNKSYRS